MPPGGPPQMRGDLTHGPIFRTLALFALPVLLGNVLQSLNGSVNTVWIGRLLGEDALFLGAESPAIPVSLHIQNLAIWTYVPFGVTIVLFGTLRSYGVVAVQIAILFTAMYVVRLGVYALLYPRLGPDALWWSLNISSLATLGLTLLAYFNGNWRSVMRGRIAAEVQPA
jgi:Na+-driven multidrug efflux pump